jgi:endo-1,4-beta-xylanase
MLAILEGHIKTVVGHYRGKVYVWDVVNEAFDNSGRLKHNIWLDRIGPEYIPLAFKWTHEADPHALLFYNDYGIEDINTKSNAVYNYIKFLKANGIPINGIGFQSHLNIQSQSIVNSMEDNMNRFGKIGLQVNITELDINISGDDSLKTRLDKQASLYKKIISISTKSKYCTAVTFWGFSDKYTWQDQNAKPLLFDKKYRKKKAYNEILNELR